MKALWLILIAFTLGHGHTLAAAPRLAVEWSDSAAAKTDFGTLNLHAISPAKTFVIKNRGDAALTLKSIACVGTQATDFVLNKTGLITSLPASTGQTSFTASFHPQAAGLRATTLRISTNDLSHPTFDIPLIGTGKVNTAPVISTAMRVVEATSAAGAVVDLASQISDAGEVAPLSVSVVPASGSTFAIGDTTVTASATDSAGLRTTGTFVVRVQDTTAPVFTSAPADVTVDATTPTGAIVTYPPAVVTDAVGGATVSYSHPSGSLLPLGRTLVVVTAADAAGNKSVRLFSITVRSAGLVVEQNGAVLGTSDTGCVVAWGYNGYGQTNVPAGLTNVVAIAAGGAHTVALKQDGTVVAWGYNYSGQSSAPAGLSGVLAITAGNSHTVALKQDGTIVAWGYNYYGQTSIPPGLTNVAAIAAGDFHTVALKQDGSVVAWGYNDYGQTSVPAGLTNVVAIAAGAYHTVALKQDGSVVAWGWNNEGQTSEPSGLNGVVAIAAGGYHTVALQRSQLPMQPTIIASPFNIGSTIHAPTFTLRNPGDAPLFISGISVVGEAASDFSLDATGTLTTVPPGGSTTFGVTFTPSVAGARAAAIHLVTNAPSAGTFDLPISGTGKVNTAPVLSLPTSMVVAEATGPAGATVTFNAGVADMGEATVPTVVLSQASGSWFPIGDTTVSASATDAEGLTTTGSFVVRVRDSTAPQIAPMSNLAVPATQTDGAMVNYPPAVATDAVGIMSLTYSKASGSLFPPGTTTVIATAKDAAGNAASRSFTATVAAPKATLEIYRPGVAPPEPLSKNSVVCWGYNRDGQASVPPGLSGVAAIAAGSAHSVALKQDGSVVAWGDNNYGQTSVPAGLTGVVAIAAGALHTVALKQDGSVVAWGWNDYYQTSVPAGLTGVTAIAAGDRQTLALKQDGSVVAWGDNGFGQTKVPPGLTGVVAIAEGGQHTVALKQDGSVVAWGENEYGQISVPTGLTGVVAIAAGDSHTIALKQDGTVVAWGWNRDDQTSVPAGLTGVATISAGGAHTMALKQDGSVVAWGSNFWGETSVPAGLSDVVAIAAGGNHTVALAMQNRMDFGNNLGTVSEHSFILHSTGTLDIAQLAASISGPDAASFSITSAALPDTLATGSSADLVLRFTPQRLGRHAATLRILSNDPNMSPCRVQLTGTGTAPEIVIESPGPLTAGSTVTMGTAVIGAPALTRTFTIRNTGTGSLDGLVISTDGTDANEFAVSTLGSATVAAGGSQSFTVSFAPTATGPRTATLHIASNDANKNPFDVVLIGQGSGIDIAFTGGARLTRPTQLIDLGTLNSGSAVEHSFTICNTGPQALTGLRVAFSGLDAAQFTLTPAMPDSLAVGESFTFTVRFSALLGGSARASTLTLFSDAANEVDVSMQFSASVLVARLVIGYGSGVVRETNQGNTVVAWGYNEFGQTSVPAGLTGVAAVAAGVYHTVALKQDGSVVSWGYNGNGQTSVPAGLSGVAAIAVGAYHTVVLKQDGSVVAWGDNYSWDNTYSGQTSVPAELTNVVAIAAGGYHTVALKQDGSVVAWGDNEYGQTSAPARLTGVVAIAAGNLHTVALKQDGRVIAWGNNDSGQTSLPAGLTGVVAIATGASHSVALVESAGEFGIQLLGQARSHLLALQAPARLRSPASVP